MSIHHPFLIAPRPVCVIATLLLSWVCLPATALAGEITAGGLSFNAARGEEACFDAGEIDGCPFRLSIKLTSSAAIQSMVNSGSLEEIQQGVTDLMAAAAAGRSEGQQIEIRIPNIYYQSGDFSAVHIFGPLGESITPEYCRGEVNSRSESNGLTGFVTLETFTPELLEGMYSANLYKRLRKIPGGGFICNDEPHVVSGRFRFSLPLLMDERFDAPLEEDELILAVGTAVWQGGAVDWSAAEWAGYPGGDPPGPGTTQSATTLEPQGCECDCEALAQPGANPLCEAMCAAQGFECEITAADAETWTVEHALEELESIGLPAQVIQMMRPSLESATPEERRVLVELYRQGSN
jgi:hypothetical protein